MSDIAHPTSETIKNFQKRHKEIASPPAEVVSQFNKQFLIAAGFFGLIYTSYAWSVNPIGANRRLQYTKSLSPVMRFTRRYLPLASVLSALVYFDTQDGIW